MGDGRRWQRWPPLPRQALLIGAFVAAAVAPGHLGLSSSFTGIACRRWTAAPLQLPRGGAYGGGCGRRHTQARAKDSLQLGPFNVSGFFERAGWRETLVEEEEGVEFLTPIEELFQIAEQLPRRFENPIDTLLRAETPLSEEEAMKFVTPISSLIGLGTFLDMQPGRSDVNASDRANYVTVELQKPIGIEFVANNKDAGGGVRIREMPRGFGASRSGVLRRGYQLVAVGGKPVHGLPIEQAVQPIIETAGDVRLTFFKGSLADFNGYTAPTQRWLSAFLDQLLVEELQSALREGRRSWELALDLLESLESSGERLDASSYATVIMACDHGDLWEKAVGLLSDMWAYDLRPNATLYNAALRACGESGHWESAMGLLTDMDEREVEMEAANYARCIDACYRSGKQIKALHVLEDMLKRGFEPDLPACNAAVAACRSHLRELVGTVRELGPSWESGDRLRRRRRMERPSQPSMFGNV